MEPDVDLSNAPAPYETITCKEDDLPLRLGEGWVVMHAYHKYELTPTFGTAPDQWGGTRSIQTGQTAVPIPHFVMGRTSRARMQWLEASCLKLQSYVRDGNKKQADQEKNIARLQKIEVDLSQARQAALAESDRYARLFAEEKKSVETLAEVNRKLETDLGKIRSAIGDLKFNEIVNPKRE